MTKNQMISFNSLVKIHQDRSNIICKIGTITDHKSHLFLWISYRTYFTKYKF